MKERMTAQRLREIAANCEDVSFIASEQNANELRAFANDLERDPMFNAWSWNRGIIEEIREAIGPNAPTLDENLVQEIRKRFSAQ